MKFKISLGSGINVDTDSGAVDGDASARKQFRSRLPNFMDLDSKVLIETVSSWGWPISSSVEEPKEEPKPKKKSGVFSKSKDDE